MSLEAILAAIEVSGEQESARIRAEAESRARQILQVAERQAAIQCEEARKAALRPAAGERARRLHQANLEALRTVGEVRHCLVEKALAETRQRLMALRTDPAYPLILRCLVKEAIRALGLERSSQVGHTLNVTDDPSDDEGQPTLEADPRDEALLRRIVKEPGLTLPLNPTLDCWGGVVARSGDGRVMVMNTLESRLERATPFLRRDLVAFIEKDLHNIDV